MARRVNYGFEKRQRELKKQKKREEKAQRKLDEAASQAEGQGDDTPDTEPVESGEPDLS